MHNAKILANIFFGLYFMVTTFYAFVCLEILFDDKSCFEIYEGEKDYLIVYTLSIMACLMITGVIAVLMAVGVV